MAEVRSVYRSFLREAHKFADYNIREYIKRRCRQGFREAPANASEAMASGREQLEIVKRQAIVYSLYQPSLKSIMEVKLN